MRAATANIPTEKIDKFLSSFPGPVTMRTPRLQWVVGVLFFAGCAWVLFDQAGNPPSIRLLLLAGCALVFSAGSLILLTTGSSLRLDAQGFETTAAWRHDRIQWQDVCVFATGRIPPARQKFVLFDMAPGAKIPGKKLSNAIAGRDAALPGTYGLSAEELACLMQRWREMACGPASSR